MGSSAGAPRADPWSRPDPPVRVARPMLVQEWRECAFLHWAYPPEALRPHVPPRFELDLLAGRAWVGLISFSIPFMRGGPLPRVPGLHAASETHLRTYVRGPDGRRGIWMLSLDMAPLHAALLGRFGFALPYWWSSTEIARTPERVRFRVRRRASARAGLDLSLRVGEPIPKARVGERDHWLTARWVLYGGAGPVRTAMLTEHPRWRFRHVTVETMRETYLRAARLPAPEGAPLAHFSDGLSARIGWPRPYRV